MVTAHSAATGGGLPRNRFPVRTRLLAAIVVPIVVMCVGAVQQINARHADVQRAERVLSLLDRLVVLTELRSALFSERLAAEIAVPARNPDPELLATSEFGRTLLDDPESLARRTDVALDAVAPQDRPFAQSELDAARADRDAWAGSISGISARLGPFYDRTVTVMVQLAEPVRTSIVTIADPRLVAAGTTFERAIAFPGAAADLMRTLTDLYLAVPERRPALQSDTAGAAAAYDEVTTRFARSIAAPESQAAHLGITTPDLPAGLRSALADARSGALTDPGRQPLEPESTGRALLTGVDWLVEVDAIPSTAAVDVRDSARRVVDQERASEQRWALTLAAVIAASVLVVVALARSIAVPVRRLTDQARRVGAGDLDVEPLPTTGPPDVAVASAAMNDVVANLTLMRQKAIALTEGQLSDHSLEQALPGPLGAELERTVDEFITTLIERQSLHTQLVHEASHDPLTGLANRKALLAALDGAAAGRPAPARTVVYIDLNGFKRVNDVHGHAGGDHLLRVVGNRLADCVTTGDLVARWGGDEFVVVLNDRTASAAREVAAKMVEAVSLPVLIDGSLVRVTACAGVASSGDAPIRAAGWANDLLRQADVAVFHAKATGAGAIVVFDGQLGEQIRRQEEVERALAAALEPSADQLYLVFQPIVDTPTGALYGIETLIRWKHPERGSLVPDDFIPIAERSDLIVRLDHWVLANALRQSARWSRELGLDTVPIAFKVGALRLCLGGLVERVLAAHDDCEIPPHRLMLEITETTLITDIDLASAQLSELRRLGVLIAIDDFGTGFTSISQLRKLPVDELKIDQSFVQGMQLGDDQVFVGMINDLAHQLGIRTVAEGVDTREQRDLLAQLGCDAMQGYLFARPLRAAEFSEYAASPAFRPT